MQVNLTQEGSASRNHSKESNYPEIIFSTNPTSPFINKTYMDSSKNNSFCFDKTMMQIIYIENNIYDIQHLK